MVQDAFMTETAEKADLVLPSTFTIENEGSFTNTQKIIQQFEVGLKSKVEQTTLQQLINLNKQFGQNGLNDAHDVMKEIISLLPVNKESVTYSFETTKGDNKVMLFGFGADSITKMWMKEFKQQFD